SVFLIQAIRKTKVKQISRSACLSFIKQDPANGQLWQDMLEQLVLQQLEREMDLLTSSPKDRYQRVLQRSPELFHRIPHKHIASYLKMAPRLYLASKDLDFNQSLCAGNTGALSKTNRHVIR